MTGRTHRVFSVAFALSGAVVLTQYGMSEVHPLVAAPVLLMSARYGALLPDVDHHWDNVADKTLPNYLINSFIHLTGGKHRSWQTHSLDVYVLILMSILFFPREILSVFSISTIRISDMLLYGVMLGWGSHLFADMLTPKGIRLFCWSRFKLRLVPKSERFSTGSNWEEICYKFIRRMNTVAAIMYVGWCLYILGAFQFILDRLPSDWVLSTFLHT